MKDMPSQVIALQPERSSRKPVRMENAENDQIDPGQILRTLWRGKWVILLASAVMVLLAGYYAFVSAVPLYSAKTTIVLKQSGPQLVDFASVVTDLTGASDEVGTQIEILRSRNLAAKVVRTLDLVADPEFNPALRAPSLQQVVLDRIKSGILPMLGVPAVPVDAPSEARQREQTVTNLIDAVTVQSVSGALVFAVTAVTGAPRKSALIADTLASSYIADQLEVKSAATVQATDWLTDRVTAQAAALSAAEKAVQDFRAQTELISPEALAALQRQVKGFRDRIAELESQRSALQDRDRLLAAPAEARAAMLAADPALAAAVGTLPVDPGVFARLVAQTQADMARGQSQITALQASLTRLTAQTEEQSADLIKLDQLTREASATGVLYNYFLNRLNETSVQQGIQQPDSRVISNAVIPAEATSPRRKLILSVALLLGLLLGAVLVLLREAQAKGFRTGEDLQSFTGYTVMGQIPRVKRHARRKLVSVLQDTATSALSEAIRNLRTSLLLAGGDTPPQVIMLTSSIPAEGKTTLSIALAHNLGVLGHRVLVIEGDLRRRVFSEYFKVSGAGGLLTAIEGGHDLKDLVVTQPGIKADVLMGQQSQINVADIYQSQAFKNFIAGLRKDYDFIVIDSPPVLAVSDARIMARFADALLYVVHWDKTTRAQVNAGLAMFESIGQQVDGLVLSQVDLRGMQRYGHGGRYGVGAEYYASS